MWMSVHREVPTTAATTATTPLALSFAAVIMATGLIQTA